jgi:hypothetical protein
MAVYILKSANGKALSNDPKGRMFIELVSENGMFDPEGVVCADEISSLQIWKPFGFNAYCSLQMGCSDSPVWVNGIYCISINLKTVADLRLEIKV